MDTCQHSHLSFPSVNGWQHKAPAHQSYDSLGRPIKPSRGNKIAFEGFEDPRLSVTARKYHGNEIRNEKGFVALGEGTYLPVTLGEGSCTTLVDVNDLMLRFHLDMESLSQVALGQRSLSELLATRLTLPKALTSFEQLFSKTVPQHLENVDEDSMGKYCAVTPGSGSTIAPSKCMGLVRQVFENLHHDQCAFEFDTHHVEASRTGQGLHLEISGKHPHAPKTAPLVIEPKAPFSIVPIDMNLTGELIEGTNSWKSADAFGNEIKKGKKGCYLKVDGFDTARLYVRTRRHSAEKQEEGSNYRTVLLNGNTLVDVDWNDFRRRFHLDADSSTQELTKCLQQRKLLPQVLDTYLRIRSAYRAALGSSQVGGHASSSAGWSALHAEKALYFTSKEILDLVRTAHLELAKRGQPSLNLQLGSRTYHVKVAPENNVDVTLELDAIQSFDLTKWSWTKPSSKLNAKEAGLVSKLPGSDEHHQRLEDSYLRIKAAFERASKENEASETYTADGFWKTYDPKLGTSLNTEGITKLLHIILQAPQHPGTPVSALSVGGVSYLVERKPDLPPRITWWSGRGQTEKSSKWNVWTGHDSCVQFAFDVTNWSPVVIKIEKALYPGIIAGMGRSSIFREARLLKELHTDANPDEVAIVEPPVSAFHFLVDSMPVFASLWRRYPCSYGHYLEKMQDYKLCPQISQYTRLACLKLAYELFDAVAHVHERDIIHGDIKQLNLLCSIFGRFRLLLADFGEARKVEEYDFVNLPTSSNPLGGVFTAPLVLQNDYWAIHKLSTELHTERCYHGESATFKLKRQEYIERQRARDTFAASLLVYYLLGFNKTWATTFAESLCDLDNSFFYQYSGALRKRQITRRRTIYGSSVHEMFERTLVSGALARPSARAVANCFKGVIDDVEAHPNSKLAKILLKTRPVPV